MDKVIPGQVSILVASYNHAQFIEQCLDSIKEDVYENKQLIIIDDGSKDNSVEVIKKWIETNQQYFKHPILFKHRPNKGLTKTLNEMLELATGEYILPIASDDYLINNSILKRVEFFKNNPNKLAIFSDCIVVDRLNNKIYDSGIEDFHKGNKGEYKNKKTLNISLILNWCVPGPVIMLKNEVFDIIGKYNENTIVEDRDLYLRLLSKRMLYFYDEIVSAYRIHDKNSIFTINHQISQYILKDEQKLVSDFKGLERLALQISILRKVSESENLSKISKFILKWGSRICKLIFMFYIKFFVALRT